LHHTVGLIDTQEIIRPQPSQKMSGKGKFILQNQINFIQKILSTERIAGKTFTFEGMHSVRLLLLFLAATCCLFLVVGLIRPWTMLWWEDIQNRKKVIQVYGSLSALFYVGYLLSKIFFN
jgi:hypothetical protein